MQPESSCLAVNCSNHLATAPRVSLENIERALKEMSESILLIFVVALQSRGKRSRINWC